LSDAKATVRILDAIKPMGGFDEEGKENPFAPASDESALDPHIWLDPIAMIEESMLVRDAFVKADPDHASTYEANANLLRKELDDLDASFREGLAHCDRREVVVSHNAFRYMAKRYGFTTYAISGLSPEEDPSPKRIAELAELAKQHDIRYIFFETLVSPKLSETIASEIGAQSLVLNPIEGLTSDDLAQGKNYVSIMRKNLQNLRTAMHCQ
jgi:zinc transport system substrate-binding protein